MVEFSGIPIQVCSEEAAKEARQALVEDWLQRGTVRDKSTIAAALDPNALEARQLALQKRIRNRERHAGVSSFDALKVKHSGYVVGRSVVSTGRLYLPVMCMAKHRVAALEAVTAFAASSGL